MRFLPLLVILTLLLSACGELAATAPSGQEQILDTIVAATLTAIPASATATFTSVPLTPTSTHTATQLGTTVPPPPTETPTPSPTPAKNVSGKVCYPRGSIPAMTIYFEATEGETLVKLPIAEGQTAYEITLEPGIYLAYAWLDDFSRGGSYSRAVLCGLKVGCDDHAPQTFTIEAGSTLEGIDLCDWYTGPFAVPYPPDKKPDEVTGSISGDIAYPAGNAPALRVVFYNLNTANWIWVGTWAGQRSYASPTSPGLAPGVYHVIAYSDNGEVGAHADTDHNLIEVTVKAGETTADVDIADWNAPDGTFPTDPTR